MAILLPFITAALLFQLIQSYEDDWRDRGLTTFVLWGVLTVGITEGLSMLHILTSWGVCIIWIVINFGLGWLVWRKLRIKLSRLSIPQNPQNWQLSLEESIFLAGVVGVCLIVGTISLVAPPNNWDSMTYVMPRVVHWMQNHSVDHYPTHYSPQLYNGPWAEFAILQFQLLFGSDRFANMLHWLSLVGSLVGVSLITKQLGGGQLAQIFATVFCATIPVGILHASTPKNTYVVTFWLVCLVYYGLRIINTQLTWNLTLLTSASLGLAVLTKGSAYIYALPIILVLLGCQLLRLRMDLFKYLIVAIAIVMSLNLGHYNRNYFTFGSPTSTYPYKWTNDVYSIPVFISNVVRNISLHLSIPFFSDSGWIDQIIIQFHRLLGISPLDQRTTLLESISRPEDFTITGSPLFEDIAGNPLHFWLIVLTIVTVIYVEKLRKNLYLIGYLITIASTFFLFCFLLKWQPWHSRLHLPIFVLLSPVIGIVLATSWHRKLAYYMLLLYLFASIPYLLFNDLRPLIGETSILKTDRVSQYFAARLPLKDDYAKVVQLTKQQSCQNIGLILRPDSWEYPLWVLFAEGQQPFLIRHIAVKNLTQKVSEPLPKQNFVPCSIIAIGIGLELDDQLTVNHHIYQKEWASASSRELIQWFAALRF